MSQPGDRTAPSWSAVEEGDYVEFWPAGALAKGRFRCSACNAEVNVRQVLPRCLLCGERLWERAGFGRAPA